MNQTGQIIARTDMIRCVMCSVCAALLILCSCVTGFAEEQTSSQALIERLVISWAAYGERDGQAMEALAAADPALGEKWSRIMDLWEAPVPVNAELPDGLPDDDTLCLVALGFQLNPDGTMREELVERLKVLQAASEKYPQAVIVCTGGRSYPMTGSDGDGYRFATDAGHTVTPLFPSLVPLTAEGKLCASLQGLSLKNVSLRIKNATTGKYVYEDFGEMLFTHYGITGPLVLSASAHLSDIAPGKYEALIDLKPALDERTLDARILSDFAKYQNRDFINALDDLLPQKMIAPFVRLCGIDERKKVNSITREERERMVQTLKGIRIPLHGFRPLDEAIITRGGVSVREVNPKTMESKLISGLYFAGEILDVDAYTGGFNLQIAFSTAVVAGACAAGAY